MLLIAVELLLGAYVGSTPLQGRRQGIYVPCGFFSDIYRVRQHVEPSGSRAVLLFSSESQAVLPFFTAVSHSCECTVAGWEVTRLPVLGLFGAGSATHCHMIPMVPKRCYRAEDFVKANMSELS